MQRALIVAGIPMQGLVASMSCCVDDDSTLFLDPVQEEIDRAQSVHFLALDGNGGVIVADSIGWIENDDVRFFTV
jgi:ribonuclease PH